MRNRDLRAVVVCRLPTWNSSSVPSRVAAIVFALGLLWARPAAAENGWFANLPGGPLPPTSGFQMLIDGSGVDGNGYRPVRVTLLAVPQVPAVANRTLRLELSLFFGYSPQTRQTVVGYVTLPAGAMSGETILSVPMFDAPNYWTLQTSEDGEIIQELSLLDQQGWSRMGWDTEAIPAILIIDSDAPQSNSNPSTPFVPQAPFSAATPPLRLPDVRQLPGILIKNPYMTPSTSNPPSGPATDDFMMQVLGTMPNVQMRPFGDLPGRWIDLTCFDMTFISAADLQTLVTQHPKAWRALRDWVATGPTLCVYDMKLSVDELRKLEVALGLEPVSNPVTPPSEFPGWQVPDVAGAVDEEVEALKSRRGNYEQSYDAYADAVEEEEDEDSMPDVQSEPAAKTQPDPTAPTRPPFAMRDVDLGRVVAIETAEPFLRTRYGLPSLLNTLGSNTWMWYQRHGLSMLRENEGYWNWMVPGVGAAPVGTFLMLITLFVVVIGPINYWVLYRSRRLHLLLVTVPVGAGLVTLALFLYALIADGLDVRVRVRGVVEVDQRAQRLVSWSRQSYYAGLAPSQGLRFPANAAVYPILGDPGSKPRMRRLLWDEDQPDETGATIYGDQHLASGYLSSRTLVQYLVVTAGPSRMGLRVEENADNADALRVTSQWSVPLKQLAVWDAQGRCFLGNDVAAGGTVELRLSDTITAMRELCSLGNANPLKFPAGYADHPFRSNRSRVYYYSVDEDYNLPRPDFMTGILENRIAIGTARYPTADDQLTRTYFATTDASPGIPLGLEEVSEESSVYVIRGRW